MHGTSNLMEYVDTCYKPLGSRRDGRGVRRLSAPLLACLFVQPVFLSVESPPIQGATPCSQRPTRSAGAIRAIAPRHHTFGCPHLQDTRSRTILTHVMTTSGMKLEKNGPGACKFPAWEFTQRRRTRAPPTRWSLVAEGTGPRRVCQNQCGLEVEESRKNSAHLTQKRHECKGEDVLTGDTIDPRRKTELHCVL